MIDDIEVIDIDGEEVEQPTNSASNGSTVTNTIVPKLIQQKPLEKKIEILKRRIRKYDHILPKFSEKIRELGEKDLGVDELMYEKNIFIQIAKLEERCLKMRTERNKMQNMLRSLDADASFPEDSETFSRPIEKCVCFSGSGYECIDVAVTHFIHSKRKRPPQNNNSSFNLSDKFYNLPAYDDIVKIIRKQNAVHKLSLSDIEICTLSQETGGKVIKFLKKYTVAERKQVLSDLIPESDSDPAIDSPELKEKLGNNEKIALKENIKIIKEEVSTEGESNNVTNWINIDDSDSINSSPMVEAASQLPTNNSASVEVIDLCDD